MLILFVTMLGIMKYDVINIVDMKITVQMLPTMKRSLRSMLPFAIIIAFGGVPNGNNSANDTANVIGNNIMIGFIGSIFRGPTQINDGSRMLAAATLLIILVNIQAHTAADPIKERLNDSFCFLITKFAILASKPDFFIVLSIRLIVINVNNNT